MKKFRVLIPVFAILFAFVAAIATPQKADPTTDYRVDDPVFGCIDQTACTLSSGNMCHFTPLDGSCATAAWRKP